MQPNSSKNLYPVLHYVPLPISWYGEESEALIWMVTSLQEFLVHFKIKFYWETNFFNFTPVWNYKIFQQSHSSMKLQFFSYIGCYGPEQSRFKHTINLNSSNSISVTSSRWVLVKFPRSFWFHLILKKVLPFLMSRNL